MTSEIVYCYLEQDVTVSPEHILSAATLQTWRDHQWLAALDPAKAGMGRVRKTGVWPEKLRTPFEATLERDRSHDAGLRHLSRGAAHRALSQLSRAVLPGWLVPALEEHILKLPRRNGKTSLRHQLRELGLEHRVTLL